MVSGVEPSPDSAERAARAVPDRPLASLFVTGYNQADTIREALEGALAQTWRPLDLLFSDDASSDATFDIMREVAERHQGREDEGLSVRVRRSARNGGLVDHVNRATAVCRGGLIAMAGGDDISRPDRVARLVEAWEASGPPGGRALLLHSAAEVIDEAGRPIGRRGTREALLGQVSAAQVMRTEAAALGAAMAWDRRLFDIFGPIPASTPNEDILLTFRATMLGPVIFVDDTLIRWRAGGISWTTPETMMQPFGKRLRFVRLRAGAHRAALEDLARVEVPDRATLVEIARERARLHGFEEGLIDAPWLARLAAGPRAFSLAMEMGTTYFPRVWLRHLFRGPYRVWWAWRTRRTRIAEAA